MIRFICLAMATVVCITLSAPAVNADENEIVITSEQWKAAAEAPAPGQNWQHVGTEDDRSAHSVAGSSRTRTRSGDAASSKSKTAKKDPRELEEMWQKFRFELAKGNINSATQYISVTTRERYKRDLETLANKAPHVIKQTAVDMEDMKVYEVGDTYALGDFRFSYEGQVISFEVAFIKDYDGVWRIEQF